jgi:hypothetical protein
MNTQSKSFKNGLLIWAGVLVVLVLIIVHMMGGGQQARFRSAIQSALSQGATTGSGATSVAEVVGRMRAIDTSGCPNDFRIAYVTHIQAWEEMAVLEEEAIKLKNERESFGAFLEAFLRGVMMDPFGKVNDEMTAQRDLQRRAQAVQRDIQLTFSRVEQVGVAYGASLPKR